MRKYLRFLLILLLATASFTAIEWPVYANKGTESTDEGDDDDDDCDSVTETDGNGSDDSKEKETCDCQNEDDDKSCDSCEDCPDDGPMGPDNACLRIVIPFGRTINEPLIPNGKFIINKERPTLSVFSPQGLFYSHNLASIVIFDETDNLPSGVAREVTVSSNKGNRIKFQFSSGESLGIPVDSSRNSVTRLRMTDASGNAVTSDPVYYELLSGFDSILKYSVETQKAVSITTPNGRILEPDSPGIQIEVIYDDAYNIRQVYSGADGLADIVITGDDKYEIRLYAPSDVSSKVDGLYTLATGATPYTTWKIGKPDSYTDIDKVKATKTVDSTDYVSLFEYSHSDDEWTMTRAGGLRTVVRYDAWNEEKTDCIETKVVSDSSSNVSYKVNIKKHVYDFGKLTIEKIVDPDGAAFKTEYTYYENSAELGYGLKKTVKNPDGSWASYQYDSNKRMTVKVESYNDAAFNSAESSAKATYYSFTPVDPADTACENDRRRRTVEVKINGITVGKTYYAYNTVSGEPVLVEEKCANPSAAYGDSSNLRTTTTSYGSTANDASIGRVKTIQFPDGRWDTYTYEYGTYTSSPTPSSCTFTAGTGNAFRRTIVHGTTSSSAGVAYKTTKEIRVTDDFGNNVMNETYIYTGSGYEKISWTVNVFDSEHHITNTYVSNGTENEATWNCCNKESETNASGIEYSYGYDLLQRMTSKTKEGYNGTADIVTTYAYDSSDKILSETVTGGSLSLSSSTVYDDAGNITSQTDSSGLTTTYSYQNGGRITTVTQAGGYTEITEKYLDGRGKSVTGTAVVPRYFSYGVNSDGSQWTKVSIGSADSTRWAKTTVDILGRVIEEESPGYTGTVATQYTYNSIGQLVKVEKTGMADTLYEYDSLGNQTRSGLDVNDNGSLDLASMDRINETNTIVEADASWWSVTTNKVYATDNNSTATTVSINKTRLTGFSGIVAESKSIDINSNVTTSTTAINRTTKTVTQTTDTPDSSTNAVSTSVNGLLVSSQSSQNLTTTFGYDDLGRRITVTDPRIGASTTAYYTTGTGKIGKVYTVTDAALNATSYDYDSSTGRLKLVENALNKKSYYAYNDHGQLTNQWGDTGYPIEKVYDSYGQLSQLKTYRNGTGWTDSSWPASTSGTAETTTWTYQTSTGLLTAKTDADSKSTAYAYTQDGKLYTRTWSRLNGGNALMTTYSYDANTAEMTGIDYSDSTQDITFTYDRLGRQKTVADAVGTRTFAYNSSLQLLTESITGLYSKTISRSYATSGMVGRYTGVNIGTEYDVDYGFDQYGRFNSVTNGTDTFTYGYLTNSNLVSTLTVGDITVNNTYETNRNLITSVENKYSSTTVSKYDYVDNAIGRMTSKTKSGTAFAQTDAIAYGYNDRSEVTSAVATLNSNYNYTYSFDNIGNRNSYINYETGSSVTSTYATNNLNQYTAITNPTNSPTYDADGNMLTNGDWAYTWNAENRLIKAEKSDQKLEFKYDYMGRRIEKKVTDKVGTIWTLTKHEYFVYDDDGLIEVLDALDSNSVKQKFIWGGNGLVSLVDGSNTYFYFCDANQNVTQLLDSSGNIVAKYEYSPFGKQVVESGSYDNPFRFSTEFYDSETGLEYYNYRYYSPELGRWTKRDPIEEEAGYNLYGMIGNDAINWVDSLGYQGRDANGRFHRANGQFGTTLEGFRHDVRNTPVGRGMIPSTPSGDRTTRNLTMEDFPSLYDPHEVGPNLSAMEVILMYRNGTIWDVSFVFARDGSPVMGREEDFNPIKEVKCKRDGQYITEYKHIRTYNGDWDKKLNNEIGDKITISGNTPPPWRNSNPSRTPQTVRKTTESKRYSRTRTRFAKYSRKLVQCKCSNGVWSRELVMDLGFRDFEVNTQTENYRWKYTGTKTKEDNETPLFQ